MIEMNKASPYSLCSVNHFYFFSKLTLLFALPLMRPFFMPKYEGTSQHWFCISLWYAVWKNCARHCNSNTQNSVLQPLSSMQLDAMIVRFC